MATTQPFLFHDLDMTRVTIRLHTHPRVLFVRPTFSAEDTPLTALALAWLWEKAGGPKGVVNVVPTPRELVQEVGNVLTTDEAIRKVSFTGSTAVGKQLLRQAASTVKSTSMELGGNAPFVVRGQMSFLEPVVFVFVRSMTWTIRAFSVFTPNKIPSP